MVSFSGGRSMKSTLPQERMAMRFFFAEHRSAAGCDYHAAFSAELAQHIRFDLTKARLAVFFDDLSGAYSAALVYQYVGVEEFLARLSGQLSPEYGLAASRASR